MIQYNTIILKFGKQGEKTGWTYIEIPADVAQKLKPGNKKSFRVKGKLDSFSIERVALLPMGEGAFIMPLKTDIRKRIGKRHGDKLSVELEEDKRPVLIDPVLIECLSDEPEALNNFNQMPKSHQNYFSKWIEGAKTEETKAKRIAQTVTAMIRKQNYAEMLHSLQNKR